MSEPPLPDVVVHLIDGAKGSLRLRILLAMEHGPRSASDLARELGVPFDQANWALKQLKTAGLVKFEREDRDGRRATAKLFVNRYKGWSALVPVLVSIARTGEEPAAVD